MVALSIDVETLGTGADAPIISVGAVAFECPEFEVVDKFYSTCQPDFLFETPDIDTLYWWGEQNERPPLDPEGPSVEEMLMSLGEWVMKYPNDSRIWTNHPSSDMVWLNEHYRRRGIIPPWTFRQWDDIHTVKKVTRDFLGLTVERPEPDRPHHALCDAEAQAEWVCNMLKSLRG